MALIVGIISGLGAVVFQSLLQILNEYALID